MHGLRNPRDPPKRARWSNTTCHRHPPCSPPQIPLPHPIQSQQPRPPWVGGWADRKLPESEKANNCLSTNKGLPRREVAHCTNSGQIMSLRLGVLPSREGEQRKTAAP